MVKIATSSFTSYKTVPFNLFSFLSLRGALYLKKYQNFAANPSFLIKITINLSFLLIIKYK